MGTRLKLLRKVSKMSKTLSHSRRKKTNAQKLTVLMGPQLRGKSILPKKSLSSSSSHSRNQIVQNSLLSNPSSSKKGNIKNSP